MLYTIDRSIDRESKCNSVALSSLACNSRVNILQSFEKDG